VKKPMIDYRCTPQVLNLTDMPPVDEDKKRLVNTLLRSMLRFETLVEHVEVGPMFIAVTGGGRGLLRPAPPQKVYVSPRA